MAYIQGCHLAIVGVSGLRRGGGGGSRVAVSPELLVCSVVTFTREQAGAPWEAGPGSNPMTPAPSEGCPSTLGTEGCGRSPPSSPLAGDLEGGHGQSQLRPRTAAVCLSVRLIFFSICH